MLMDEKICSIIDKGASFCHVRMIMVGIRGVPWVTSGSQKWKGAIPSFIVRAISVIVVRVWSRDELIVHCPENRLLR